MKEKKEKGSSSAVQQCSSSSEKGTCAVQAGVSGGVQKCAGGK